MFNKISHKILEEGVKWIDKIILVMALCSGVILVMIMLIGNFEVIARYVFRASVGWALEVPEFLMLMCSALALAYTEKVGRHVSVKILEEKLPQKANNIIAIAISPIYLFMAGGMLWGVTRWAIMDITGGCYSFMAEIPLIIPRSFLVIGFAFLIVQVLINTTKNMLFLRR